MAITTNKKVKSRSVTAEFDAFNVSGSVHIYQGGLVAVKADETLVQGSNTSGLTGVGIAREEADNTDGTSGALRTTVWTSGEFSLATTGSVAYGDKVYLATDLIVAASGALASNAIFVGTALEEDEETSGQRWIRLGQAKSGY